MYSSQMHIKMTLTWLEIQWSQYFEKKIIKYTLCLGGKQSSLFQFIYLFKSQISAVHICIENFQTLKTN